MPRRPRRSRVMNQLWGEGGEGSCREDPGEGTGLSEDFCNFPSGCALLVLGGPAGIRLLGVPRGADGTPRWKVRPRIRLGDDREEVGAAWGAQVEAENSGASRVSGPARQDPQGCGGRVPTRRCGLGLPGRKAPGKARAISLEPGAVTPTSVVRLSCR